MLKKKVFKKICTIIIIMCPMAFIIVVKQTKKEKKIK